MKVAVFWVVAPCSLVEIARRFGGAYCLHNQIDEYAARNFFFVVFIRGGPVSRSFSLVSFPVDRVALGQVFLPVLLFSPVSIILPLLHIHACIIWGLDKGAVSDRSSTQTQYSLRCNYINMIFLNSGGKRVGADGCLLNQCINP
jgi:hypothetical protein